jgi:hypothetical protein
MQAWYKVATPRKEVREGRSFNPDEFAIHHRALGPGLLESAYEECLCRELSLREIPFERQRPASVAG